MADSKVQQLHESEGPVGNARIFEVNTAPFKVWANLVGLPSEVAKAKILEEDTKLMVQILPDDAFVTMDFNRNRVRIFVDNSGVVAKPPKKG